MNANGCPFLQDDVNPHAIPIYRAVPIYPHKYITQTISATPPAAACTSPFGWACPTHPSSTPTQAQSSSASMFRVDRCTPVHTRAVWSRTSRRYSLGIAATILFLMLHRAPILQIPAIIMPAWISTDDLAQTHLLTGDRKHAEHFVETQRTKPVDTSTFSALRN